MAMLLMVIIWIMQLIKGIDIAPFARTIWADAETQKVWQQKIDFAASAYSRLERETVKVGLRRCTTMHAAPEKIDDIARELARQGLIFLPYKKVGCYEGFAHYHPPIIDGKPWEYYGPVASKIEDTLLFVEAEDKGDHETIGDLLGYPECCFDDVTEVLTSNGWKYFRDVTQSDQIATVTAGSLRQRPRLEFHPYTDKQVLWHSGPMITWTGRAVDLMVTGDHKMFVRNGGVHKAEDQAYRFVSAKETAALSHPYMPKSVSWDGTPREFYEAPGIRVPMNDWLKLLGWYLSEGCVSKTSPEAYKVNIAQKRGSKWQKIIDLFKDLGFDPCYSDCNVFVSSKALYDELEPFGHSNEKYVPAYVKSLPMKQIRIFLDAIFDGDGTSRNYRHTGYRLTRYYTTSKRLADDIQELLFRIGWAGSISLQKPRSGSIRGERLGVSQPQYLVCVATSNDLKLQRMRQVNYEGWVYDLTVPPHHTLVVRRNGKIAITGNCSKFFREVWMAGYIDPVWQAAAACGKCKGEIVNMASSSIFTGLRYIGVRLIPHLPCSFRCAESIAMSHQWIELSEKLQIPGRIELIELLTMPLEWNCFKGIAEITTRHFRVVTNSTPCYPKYTVKVG
jgi:hypothetical protein